jgi:hypothetical protein
MEETSLWYCGVDGADIAGAVRDIAMAASEK